MPRWMAQQTIAPMRPETWEVLQRLSPGGTKRELERMASRAYVYRRQTKKRQAECPFCGCYFTNLAPHLGQGEVCLANLKVARAEQEMTAQSYADLQTMLHEAYREAAMGFGPSKGAVVVDTMNPDGLCVERAILLAALGAGLGSDLRARLPFQGTEAELLGALRGLPGYETHRPCISKEGTGSFCSVRHRIQT